ncbi:sulfonate ABC transporter substrate-binding protein [Trinickia sp. NRRL B-1857]|uniref:sulfonate ABC transporter substrate-binding protein n=1 Tax=Trinickia sp. NRRL B-1857 TaxID=3162879 RepID=UPI003D271BA1
MIRSSHRHGAFFSGARAAFVALLLGAFAISAHAATTLRIGWQKGSDLSVIKARGVFERTLEQRGIAVRWIEFPAGPQMLEALNVGGIDLGVVGETPPVFAQAASDNLLYVGVEPPAPTGEALLVPKSSAIKTLADLKGKRIAFNRGSNVHYLLVRLLEKAHLSYDDVKVTYLTPSDGFAAFENGNVDAWVIWDPYASAAVVKLDARVLADASGGVADNHQFYTASRSFAQAHADALKFALARIDDESRWIGAHRKEAAQIVAPQIGLPIDIAERSLSHASYGVTPLDADVVASQQRIADTFFRLKLIPKQIDIATAVWH